MVKQPPSNPIPRELAQLTELWSTAGKILAQELRMGCGDRTVLGGLEKFLSRWVASVASLENAYPTWPEAKQIISLLTGYGQKPVSDRTAAVRAAGSLTGEVVERIRALALREPLPAAERRGDVGTGGQGDGGTWIENRIPITSTKPTPSSAGKGQRAEISRRSALNLDDPIIALRGVGKQRASLLAKLGIAKIRDLLYHFPRGYRDYRAVRRIVELLYGETVSIVGMVEDVQVIPGARKLYRTTVKVKDETGRMSATWFRHGYGGVRVTPNSRIALAGTVSGYGSQLNFESPDWEPADLEPLHTRRMVPLYPLTEGVSDYWLRETMAGVVPAFAHRLEEHLPEWLVQDYSLLPFAEAVARVHFPRSPEESEQARRRLAFDELFLVQLAALKIRAEWQEGARANQLRMDEGAIEQFLALQPFSLTRAQRKVIAEIRGDLALSRPMIRLLQGDVGSGKTIVAAVAMLLTVAGGCQAALMAPTEILAEQHARTLRAAYENAGALLERLLGRSLRLELLTGASRSSDRDRIYRETADGKVDILVGTQALIQDGVGFSQLGLAVIDEQHRFGVAQRSALREKGGSPHLLVMTATPIPRTLALVMYGDLDLSIIDELPPGRQQIKTHLLGPLERTVAYEHIRREVAKGRQAFIICPLVEDSPHLEVRAATAEYERLRGGELSELRLALLHGRMRPAEKDQIMRDFRNEEYDVLVSTSVVEVGVDVPNATVMLVEGAERFGLAQLHQLRGRVGRGSHTSCCILLTDSTDEVAQERLRTVASISDGFRLADEDLKLRGPGEYLGVRQSGFPDFHMADLRDIKLIEMARDAAARMLSNDPRLEKPEHRQVASRLEEMRRAGNS